MRYYLVITPFFPENGSFRGPYILDQVKAIQRNSDYKVVVMKPAPFYSNAEDYEYDGVKVYRFRDYTIPSNMWPNKLCDWLTSKSLLAKIRTLGISIQDIAIAHGHVTKQGAYANYLKHLNPNIRSMVQHHGFDVMGISDGRLAKYKFHERQCISHGVDICNGADLNIGVSQKTLDYVLKQPGIHLKHQYVLYNGVDTHIFNEGATLSKNSRMTKGDEIFHIGCIGNFWELKDQITLIKAVEILVNQDIKNIKTIFIGSGYTLDGCKAYVKEHRLEQYIEFRTEVMHEQLPDFYRSLDLFILPSYWEAFGCVYTEAYACGVPFIGVKGQGIAEIIPDKDKDRWLIEKGDFGHLSVLINEKRNSPDNVLLLESAWKIDELIAAFLKFLKKVD
jgi:glycosyltransferase, group 1 family